MESAKLQPKNQGAETGLAMPAPKLQSGSFGHELPEIFVPRVKGWATTRYSTPKTIEKDYPTQKNYSNTSKLLYFSIFVGTFRLGLGCAAEAGPSLGHPHCNGCKPFQSSFQPQPLRGAVHRFCQSFLCKDCVYSVEPSQDLGNMGMRSCTCKCL